VLLQLVVVLHTKPAALMSAQLVAAGTFSSWTTQGPDEMVSFTVEPAGTLEPANGACMITSPSSYSSSVHLSSVAQTRPKPVMSLQLEAAGTMTGADLTVISHSCQPDVDPKVDTTLR
jgi:hypothetical protein